MLKATSYVLMFFGGESLVSALRKQKQEQSLPDHISSRRQRSKNRWQLACSCVWLRTGWSWAQKGLSHLSLAAFVILEAVALLAVASLVDPATILVVALGWAHGLAAACHGAADVRLGHALLVL